MMLASPFLPTSMFSSQHNSDESMHCRPSKDMEAFNSLLPPPIEFVEGSSSGTLAVAEGKYEPINSSPKPSKAELVNLPKRTPATPTKVTQAPSHQTGAKALSLYPTAIDTSWPASCNISTGLYNSGNTCFLNSALQCLLHTPPLLRLLISHRKDDCRVTSLFCMACALRQVVAKAHGSTNRSPFSPSSITNNLQIQLIRGGQRSCVCTAIAKHMRKGRQEDTHEFLRYAIDALQKSCLAGQPTKIDPKLAETTWVHKIFGGQLRSRVSCRSCGHNSDTFDRILDLSLDIFRCDSLKEALRRFIAIDYLKGADKYKCEKCKKAVNAEKNFTIHEAPIVLTVHLKRFSPMGKKISHPLSYDEELSLQPFMSEGQFGPSYSLYGVICHAGGGPNSGHYYAFVKSKEGRWAEMNDEMVQASSPPADKRNAYMLFYIQNKGQGLEAAVRVPSTNKMQSSSTPLKMGLANGMKKKIEKSRDDDEDQGVKVSSAFIGPLLPSAEISVNGTKVKQVPLSPVDPQALSLKSKIQAAAKTKVSAALESLENYDSDNSDDKEAQAPSYDQDRMDVDVKGKEKDNGQTNATEHDPSATPTLSSTQAIPPSSFYGVSPKAKKRKFSDSSSENHRNSNTPLQARTKGYTKSLNPYTQTFTVKRRKRMGI